MRLRGIIVSVATVGLMVGPSFAHGVLSSVAGAKAECTITGTAANDNLFGTTRDDVICAKAGSDNVSGGEGNDIIRGGQGDDGDGLPPCMDTRPVLQGNCRGSSPTRGRIVVNGPTLFGLNGDDGSDVVKGQADDDSIEGQDQNDRLYGGQGADCLGAGCTAVVQMQYSENGNDFLKSRDHVSGNDFVDGGNNTDTCRIDAGDDVYSCEL